MSKKSALLDPNVLLALAWLRRQYRAAAQRWFQCEARYGWGTCTMTQSPFILLSSNPACTAEAVSPGTAAILLQRYCKHPRHRFWESPPAAEPRFYQQALGCQQVTDAWKAELVR